MSEKQTNFQLKYQPFASIINPGFWQQLTNIKLNKLRLSKDPVQTTGSYSCGLSDNLPCLASFDHNSFSAEAESFIQNNKASCPLYGQLICTNIMQEFLDCNKKQLLDSFGGEVWQAIVDGRALVDPEKFLSKFGLLVYADLKKYKFLYWFSFPSLNYPKEVYYVPKATQTSPSQPILSVLSEKALGLLQAEFDKPKDLRHFQRSYFIVKHYKISESSEEGIQVFDLSHYKESLKESTNQLEPKLYFAFADPSSHATYPGWPMRNYLCLIATQFHLERINIIRIRTGLSTQKYKLELQHSLVMEVHYELSDYDKTITPLPKTPLITGWEKNQSQQMAPKRVCLSNLLDPKKLAEDALNLNLRLMKWRLLPSLNLDKIAATKCLLLGCGTLGCHISRGLLAWGVKTISLVDNAKISYSNPVRQSLYTFDDCASSSSAGKFKAEAALEGLRRIHPLINGQAHVLSIPMPGHHIPDTEIEQTRKDISTLQNLIESHDAVFLLMDTRESRWLPTVIAMAKQKLVINAAIGFDTFLLQRYGIRNYSNLTDDQILPISRSFSSVSNAGDSQRQPQQLSPSSVPSDKLGCYFCNDIVAPGDSTQDRTLDQQCTVSRPGVSMMVSALAIELLASVISSKDGELTAAPLGDPSDDDYDASDLGLVPHCVRGNLSRFQMYMPTSPSFSKCSACSAPVVNAFKISGYEFLERVFDDPSYLEDVAGLKELQGIDESAVWAMGSEDEDDHDES